MQVIAVIRTQSNKFKKFLNIRSPTKYLIMYKIV